jgi:hypothetical protein
MCTSWKNPLKWSLDFFSFGQIMKKIIMVKVGYLCMGQRITKQNKKTIDEIL